MLPTLTAFTLNHTNPNDTIQTIKYKPYLYSCKDLSITMNSPSGFGL